MHSNSAWLVLEFSPPPGSDLCCTLCSAIDCLVRFPKQARLTPQNRSLFDKQCITVKYFEGMKMELQRKIAFVLGESIVSCFRVLSCLTIELRWSIF